MLLNSIQPSSEFELPPFKDAASVQAVDAAQVEVKFFKDLIKYQGNIDGFDTGGIKVANNDTHSFAVYPIGRPELPTGSRDLERLALHNGGIRISAGDEPLKIKFLGKAKQEDIVATEIRNIKKNVSGLLVDFPESINSARIASALLVLQNRLGLSVRRCVAGGCDGLHFRNEVELSGLLKQLRRCGWITPQIGKRPNGLSDFISIASRKFDDSKEVHVRIAYDDAKSPLNKIKAVLVEMPKGSNLQDQCYFVNLVESAAEAAHNQPVDQPFPKSITDSSRAERALQMSSTMDCLISKDRARSDKFAGLAKANSENHIKVS